MTVSLFVVTTVSFGQISKEEVERFLQEHPVSSVDNVFIERGVLGNRNQSNGKIKFVKNTIEFNAETAKIEALQNSIRVSDASGIDVMAPYERLMYLYYQPETKQFYSSISFKIAD